MHCSPIVQGIIALLSYDVDNRVDDGAILDIWSFQSDQKVHKTTIIVFWNFCLWLNQTIVTIMIDWLTD